MNDDDFNSESYATEETSNKKLKSFTPPNIFLVKRRKILFFEFSKVVCITLFPPCA